MPSFIRSNLATILPLLQQQLATFLQFPLYRVVLQKQGGPLKLATLQADQYVVIRPEAESFNRRQIQSAGRTDARVDRAITFVCWSRLNLDYYAQDYSWLIDPHYGELYFEQAVKNALLTWIPTDSGNNVLAVPTRISEVTGAVSDQADWGHAEGRIWYQMYLDVNQANIFPGANR